MYVAEVSVDLHDVQRTIEDFVALQEVGRVLHPILAEGQIIGGVAQAIGFALYEKVVWDDGRMRNNQMTNYIMPTSAICLPSEFFLKSLEIRMELMARRDIGELPMDGPAPAILNAVEDALWCALRGDSDAAGGYSLRPWRIVSETLPCSPVKRHERRRKACREICDYADGER